MAFESGINFNYGHGLSEQSLYLSSSERLERVRRLNSDADSVGEPYTEMLDEITGQISELTKLKLSIKASIKEENNQLRQLGALEAKALEEALSNPDSPDNLAYRTAMLLPKMGGSSLEEPDTLEAAHALGEQLLDLNSALEGASKPQQIVAFNFRHTNSGQWYEDLDITFGFTQLAEGLKQDSSEDAEVLSPSLLIPVDQESLRGVHPSMYTPEWYYEGAVNYVNGTKYQTSSNLIPRVHQPKIILPTGSLYIDRADSIALYDRPDGTVGEIIAASWNLNFGQKSFIAIGKKSVARTLNALVQRSREMADANHPEMRAHPDTLSDMRTFVISGLKRSKQKAR